MVRICPFISINQPANRACTSEDCSLFVKTDQLGKCAVAVIAEEMRSSSAGIDLIADNLEEIVKGIDKVVNTLKGMI